MAVSKVALIHSLPYAQLSSKLPSNESRAMLIHTLLEAYQLHQRTLILEPRKADIEELSRYHDADYLHHLMDANDDINEEYGLVDDCPKFPELPDYCLWTAGASLVCAEFLIRESQVETPIAIHWNGGRHHARKDEARGFCYVNDIVLAILQLRSKFKRILYIDVDVHHGDGVQEAFYFSKQVMTVSFHRYGPGFFPGSGSITENGAGSGKDYCRNIPLESGLSDKRFIQVFNEVLPDVCAGFQPDCVVVCTGADGLAGDRMCKEWNLTEKSFVHLFNMLKSWKLPLLVLGGGGYHHANTARLYCTLTAVLSHPQETGSDEPGILAPDIPEHDYFEEYAPDFQLCIHAGNMCDQNKRLDMPSNEQNV